MSKEDFKYFAQQHPELAKEVLTGKTTWQKLYELYDIYGSSSNVWNSFIEKPSEISPSTIKDIFNTVRNLDMESVQKGVTNIQKTIGLLQELGLTKNNNTYEPRPIYRRFED